MKWLPISVDKVHQIAFYIFTFTIPINQFISTRLLIVVAVISLLSHRRWSLTIKNSWDMVVYFIVLAGGLTYSTDVISGFRVLEASFPLIVLPMAAAVLPTWKKSEIHKVFKSFVWGAFLACVICLANTAIILVNTGLNGDFFADNFTSILGFQPLYFAYYLIFGITYCLFTIYHQDSDFSPMRGMLISIILFLALLFTGSKTSFVSLLLVFSFFILKVLVEERNSIKLIVSVLMVGMLVCVVMMSMLNIRNWNASSDAWERIALWESGIKAVPNIVFGAGTGDYKVVLNEYYRNHHLTEFAKDGMNAHNQMIQILFSNGILGLLSFLLLITHPIYRAFKSRNMLALVSYFPFIVYGITEVFLGRYQGVVFYAWLHLVFLSIISQEESKLPNSTVR